MINENALIDADATTAPERWGVWPHAATYANQPVGREARFRELACEALRSILPESATTGLCVNTYISQIETDTSSADQVTSKAGFEGYAENLSGDDLLLNLKKKLQANSGYLTICDFDLPAVDGIELISSLRSQRVSQVLLFSAFPEPRTFNYLSSDVKTQHQSGLPARSLTEIEERLVWKSLFDSGEMLYSL
jgi:hypothetical protein